MTAPWHGSSNNGKESYQSGHNPRMVLVYSWITRYRATFNEALRDDLAVRGIDLRVVHGSPIRMSPVGNSPSRSTGRSRSRTGSYRSAGSIWSGSRRYAWHATPT